MHTESVTRLISGSPCIFYYISKDVILLKSYKNVFSTQDIDDVFSPYVEGSLEVPEGERAVFQVWLRVCYQTNMLI